jgi:hypothetical protein
VTFIRGRQIGWTEKKQQVPPLRFAPVGMTILWGPWVGKENRRSLGFARDDNKGTSSAVVSHSSQKTA